MIWQIKDSRPRFRPPQWLHFPASREFSDFLAAGALDTAPSGKETQVRQATVVKSWRPRQRQGPCKSRLARFWADMYREYRTLLLCPACGREIRKLGRYFGPRRIRCRGCGVIIETRLKEWADLCWHEKTANFLAEILFPSGLTYGWPSLNSSGKRLWQAIGVFGLQAVLTLAAGVVICKTGWFMASGIPVWLPFLSYPLIILIRAVWLVRASNRRRRSVAISTW